jgi:hypothetical protein
MRERPGFLVNDRLAPAQPHDRGVARGAVGLLVDLDVGHGDLGGDMTFLSPIRRLCDR